RMIIRIKEREREERLAAANICEVYGIGDERHLTQHRQRTNLREVEESLGAATGKEILVEGVDEVVAAEREHDQFALLQVDRKQLGDIHGGDREYRSVAAWDDSRRIDGADCAGTGHQRSAKPGFRLDFRRPVVPPRQFSEVEVDFGLCSAVVFAAGSGAARRHTLIELRQRTRQVDTFVLPCRSSAVPVSGQYVTMKDVGGRSRRLRSRRLRGPPGAVAGRRGASRSDRGTSGWRERLLAVRRQRP